MKKILLLIALLFPLSNTQAYEKSECDGISEWKESSQNSPDVMTRTCNLFGMNFIEIKSRLNESRCIAINNTKTGDQWKHFFLRNQTTKALANPYFDPKNLAIASKKSEKNRCNS